MPFPCQTCSPAGTTMLAVLLSCLPGARASERFTDDTRENSIYFNLAQGFRLRVNEATDLAQRLTYSPRPENLGDYLIQG